jgi:hypothetical protein
MRWAPQTPQIGKISTAKRSIDIRTPGKLRPARLGGGYAGESSADAERPAQQEAATEIDEIIVTGQRDYLYRAGHQHSARRAAGHGERDHRRFS